MITIISTTNRPNSMSAQVADFYLSEFQAKGVTAQVVKLEDLPHDFTFSALYANSGKNGQFNVLRDKVQEAEKLLFIVPEYNGSFPGVLKSFIDGLKFPEGLRDKKAAMVGISSGTMGASLAMSALTDILNYLGCHVFALKPRVTAIENSFSNGKITEPTALSLVNLQIEQFSTF